MRETHEAGMTAERGGPIKPSDALLEETFHIWNGWHAYATTWEELDDTNKERWTRAITLAMNAASRLED